MPFPALLLAGCQLSSWSPAEPGGPPVEADRLGAAPPSDTGWPPGDPLPALLLSPDGPIGEDERVGATIEIVRSHDGTLGGLEHAAREVTARAAIEARGKSSATFPKRSYGFELQDADGADLALPLLGMPPEADWVLYGPYTDKTYVRSALAYALARRMGRYAPRVRFVEVLLDGELLGLYQLTEKPELDPHRVDLREPGHGDRTGGYLFKLEGGTDGGAGWTSTRGVEYELHDPGADEINPAQLSYLRGWVDAFEEATEEGAAPSERVDVAALVDYAIVQELSRNVDGYRRSTFLQKPAADEGGRLVPGPVWDFDIAFGNADFCDGWNPEGLVWQSAATCDDWDQIPDWWIALLEDPRVTGPLRCRWVQLRGDVLADDAVAALVAELAAPVADAETRDHALWGTLGQRVWPNAFVGATWEEELDYLVGWTATRSAWLDTHMPGTCP